MRPLLAASLLCLLSAAGELRAAPLTLALDEDLLHDVAAVAAPQAATGWAPLASAAPAQKKSGSSSDGGSPPTLSGFGVGLQIGDPTALTVKFGAGGNANIVLGVGAAGAYRGFGLLGLSLHGDYLFTVANLVSNGTLTLSAYIGPGLWVTVGPGGYYVVNGIVYGGAFGAPFSLAGRFPLGLNARFTAAPVEVYVELDPALVVFPGIGFGIGASLGFRWFF
jgi:hypothetical protein